jgi:hypothetical protein
MAQSDDQKKLTAEERRALDQYVSEHPDSTLSKDERTARYIQRMRLKGKGQTPAKQSEIARDATREEKYGSADWTPPDLTQALPKQPSAALWDALERFINFRDSNRSLEAFRSRYPAFLPPWFYRVACGNDAELQRETGLLAWQAWRSLLRAAWHSSFHPEYVAQLVNIPTVPPGNARFEIAPVCDAQRAVLAMALESWRARFCPKCGRPFVARRSANKFCSTDCFAEQRREKQRAAKRYRARKRSRMKRRARQ